MDRLQAKNERDDKNSFTTELQNNFEVKIYMSISPYTGTNLGGQSSKSSGTLGQYFYYRARSLAGHHDDKVSPELARTEAEYELLRNSHFQAIIKKDIEAQPQMGQVWNATYLGGGMVSLNYLVREESVNLKLSEDDESAKNMFNNSSNPVSTVAATSETQDTENMMSRNKASRDILKKEISDNFKAQGLPFVITSEVRNVDKQVNLLKKQYSEQGRDELLNKYGKNTLGLEIVSAIESGNDSALRAAAQKSTRHLRGLAIDVRSKNMTTEQINKALNILTEMGLTYILEMTTTGCWDKAGKNVTNVKRLHPAGGPNRGDPCYAEHIHISVPEGYGK